MGSFVGLGFGLAAGLVVLLLLLFRWRWCLVRTESGVESAPWLAALLWTLMLVYNPALDVDPFIAAVCWSTLPLLGPGLVPGLGRRSPWTQLAVVGVLGAGLYFFWMGATEAPGERVVVRFWAIAVAPVLVFGNRWLVLRDRLWLALVVSVMAQFLLGEAPRQDYDHGGTLIGKKDYAYTFCENQRLKRLYAAVPCDGLSQGCLQGFIAEHDLTDLSKPPVELEFFSESFRGRLVHLVCLEDEVIVGMARTQVDGREYQENAMSFSVDDPTRFERSLFGPLVGPRLAWDPRHRAIYYTSEWSKKIYRHDLVSDVLDDRISDAIYGRGGEPFGSHTVENDGFHQGRDSVIFAQWLTGSQIFEIDRETLELAASFDPLNGGNIAAIVDEGPDLIWATGVWGVDVVDLQTGEVRMRKRLGMAPRLPVVDRVHDIVYVPTTAGRIWAFDRNGLETLGSLLIGGGGRNPYISKDGRYLFAGAQHGYFYWETAALAERFRPAQDQPPESSELQPAESSELQPAESGELQPAESSQLE